MSENLWPDFIIGQALSPPSPKDVIQQAGSGLKEKTHGLVEFYVEPASIRDKKVEVKCNLYTPALGYHFPFLRAIFAIGAVYPVTLVADKMPDIVANDENELRAALAKIFRASSTIETISTLMSVAQQGS